MYSLFLIHIHLMTFTMWLLEDGMLIMHSSFTLELRICHLLMELSSILII